MENSLQAVVDVVRELEINEPEALQQARDMANFPEKGPKWYRQCADYLKMLKRQEARVDLDLGPIRAKQFEVYKMTKDLMNRLINPRKQCREIVSVAMVDWKREDDLRVKADQDRLMAESVKQADDERLAAAEQLSAGGHLALAEAILSDAGFAPARIVQGVKVDGIKHKNRWRGRVVNKMHFIKAVVADPGLLDAFKVDQVWLDNYVNEKQGKVTIDGVEPYEEGKIDVRESA